MIRPTNPNFWNISRKLKGPFKDTDAFYGTDYGFGLVELLSLTGEFDSIAVGRKEQQSWLSSEHRISAVFEIKGCSYRNDGSQDTRIRVVPYSLAIEYHENWQDAAYRKLDMLESLVMNILMDKSNRSYGGFTLEWMSRIGSGKQIRYSVPSKIRQLDGEFGYRVPKTISEVSLSYS
jgi:hypothetical protein